MVDPQSWRFEPTVATPRAGGIAGRIGQYDLLEPIGRGGMGVVWKGTHRHLGQVVAIKFLAPEAWSDPQAVARFYREMRAIGRVIHPNLIRALDAGDYDGHHVLVMEFVEGETLRDVLQRHGRLTIGAACEVIRQAANGLAAIDAAGMVHRDVKPSNLFLTREGTVKILDLGLARIPQEGEDREFTSTDQILGTIDYMAPEQSADSRAVDVRTDLYSLGCTLYALLVGAPPFTGPSYSSLESRLRAHRVDRPRPLRDVRRDVPAPVASVVERLLEKNPESRMQSPAELVAALVPFASPAEVQSLLTVRHSSESTIDRPAEGSSLPLSSSPVETSRVTVADRAVAAAHPHSTQPMTSTGRRKLLGAGLAAAAVLAIVVASLVSHATRQDERPKLPEPGSKGEATPSPAEGATVEEQLRNVPDFSESPLLRWQDLIREKPVPVFWKDDEGLALFDWREAERRLFATHAKIGILSLGTIDRSDFELQMGLHQTGWPGGAGVFVAMQNGNPAELSDWRCLALTIDRVEAANGPSTHRLAVSRVRSIPSAKRAFDFHMTSFASEEIEPPVGEISLQLTIRNNRLTAIRCNGQRLGDLVELVNENSPPSKWTGGFGVFVTGAGATFRNAQIRRLDSER